MKKIVLTGAITLAGIGIYFTGVYTYFIKNKISEELPSMSPGSQGTVSKEPKILKQGKFVNADFFHKGSGQAYIIEYTDGRKILRFENFKTVNGPDLYVYLSKSAAPAGDLKNLNDFIDLGRLKGNVGDQNYDLTQNIQIEEYQSAVIWCKKFGVLFPYAVLK